MIQCAPAGEQYRTVYAAADDDLGARLAWHDSRAHPALAVPVAGVTLDGSIEAVVTTVADPHATPQRWFVLFRGRVVYFDHHDAVWYTARGRRRRVDHIDPRGVAAARGAVLGFVLHGGAALFGVPARVCLFCS